MWLCIFLNKNLKPDKKRDIEKFEPFVRTDYHEWSYFLTLFTHFFFWPRFFAAWLVIAVGVLIMFIMMLGKRRDAQVNSWADFVIGETISWGGRLIMLIWGIVWIKNI